MDDTVDEVSETTIADFLGGILDIFGGGIDAAGSERCVVLESAGRFADVAGKSLDEIAARPLFLARLVLELVRRPGGHILGDIEPLP